MASTAAGVAVGHTMGQGLSSMLFGGGSKEEAPVAAPQSKAFDEPRMGGQCETSAKGKLLLPLSFLGLLTLIVLPFSLVRFHPMS